MRGDYMPAWMIQATGLVLILFFAAVWYFTNRVEPTLLAAAGTLIGIGQYQQAKRSLTNGDAPPVPPPPIAKEPPEERRT